MQYILQFLDSNTLLIQNHFSKKYCRPKTNDFSWCEKRVQQSTRKLFES